MVLRYFVAVPLLRPPRGYFRGAVGWASSEVHRERASLAAGRRPAVGTGAPV